MLFLLDIYFQRGEFNIESSGGGAIWRTILGSIIGAVVSIFIWVLTYLRDKKKEDKRRQKLDKERVNYLQHLSRNALSSIVSQVQSILDFTESIKTNPYEVGMLKMSMFSDLNRIVNRIDLEQHYHSYLSIPDIDAKASERFRRLITAFDFANKQIEEIPLIMEAAKKYHFERVKSYQSKNDIVESIVLSLIQKNLTSDTIFFKRLSNLRRDFTALRAENNDSNGLEFHHENYIEKLKLLCGEFIGEDITLTQILSVTKEMTLLVNEIKGNNLEFGKSMDRIRRTLNIVACRLPSNFEWLKKK